VHLEGAVALDPLLRGLDVLIRLDVRADVRGDEEVRHHGMLAEVAQALEECQGRLHPPRVEDHRNVLHTALGLVRRVEALEQGVGRQAAHQLVMLPVGLRGRLNMGLRDHSGAGLSLLGSILPA